MRRAGSPRTSPSPPASSQAALDLLGLLLDEPSGILHVLAEAASRLAPGQREQGETCQGQSGHDPLHRLIAVPTRVRARVFLRSSTPPRLPVSLGVPAGQPLPAAGASRLPPGPGAAHRDARDRRLSRSSPIRYRMPEIEDKESYAHFG